MARKVFMSVLGTGFYSECTYVGVNTRTQTRFIQEATLNEIGAKGWNSEDSAYVFITDRSETDNWIVKDNCRTNLRSKEVEQYNGLQKVLDDMSLPCTVESVKIKDGKDENEMWDIFNTIYGCIHDGDELYFDLTHAFRYLPMLVLVLGSYAKFLKNVKIAYISYGNFDSRTKCPDNPGRDEAPIIDLLPLSILQDWTFAAGQFIKSGNVEEIVKLCENEFLPLVRASKGKDVAANALRYYTKVLSSTIQDLRFCRGVSLIDSDNIISLKRSTLDLGESMIDSLNPLLGKIVASFGDFDDYASINNAYKSAVWCYNKGMFQQSATILQETVVTFFCRRHGLNELVEEDRRVINDTFFAINQDRELSGKHKDVVNDEYMNEALAKSFDKLSKTRNNFNHAGMKRDCKTAESMRCDINEALCSFQHLFALPKIFINYTNHPVKDWSEEQVSAAKKYAEELVDIPFIVIDPDKDEDDIEKIADSELKKILKVAEGHDATVHLMGEQTLSFSLIKKLQGLGVRCVASTTKREVKDLGDNKREVTFRFVKFREY